MDNDLQKRFRAFELFKHLSDQDIVDFERICVTRKFNKGTTIYVPGEKRDRVFLVISGEVKVYQISNGKKITIDAHREGGLFGDLSFAHKPFDAKPTNYAEALSDVSVCAISSYDLTDYLKSHTRLALGLLVNMRNRLHMAESKIRDLALFSADIRIINELIRHSLKHGNDQGDYFEIPERLTHQEVSEMTGLARETVSKVLAGLTKSGMIELSDDKFFKLNKKKIIEDCIDCIKVAKLDIFS
ncbi:MAG: hypothetical protein COT91_01260 [Candidatus Doudnabacteria bacterium CG10_big_fil_rev_8_21_14_0_10_41_10]|uniref:Crp/Fnr family transcriptional regulator n=1 Tax=Candidatus Doudnabacteria bacterium CG10_big_fil_rev_8_21_14_0_10_41_10 TaxID=1974551 RepID=A0A2H0VEI7_9BACT|nr:MAG: hypothetical protein COT91_01260 [Candidatus Doudnabacteria bacterium CG10_big_fil_rev_8_21_14_0_10_41_10]